jgi:hypothetical protein
VISISLPLVHEKTAGEEVMATHEMADA